MRTTLFTLLYLSSLLSYGKEVDENQLEISLEYLLTEYQNRSLRWKESLDQKDLDIAISEEEKWLYLPDFGLGMAKSFEQEAAGQSTRQVGSLSLTADVPVLHIDKFMKLEGVYMDQEVKELEALARQQQLLFEAARAYIRLIFRKKVELVVDENIKGWDEYIRIAKIQYELGAGSLLPLASAKAQLKKETREKHKILGAINESMNQIRFMLQLPADTTLIPKPFAFKDLRKILATPPLVFVNEALQQRPDLMQEYERYNKAIHLEKAVRSEFIPALNFRGKFQGRGNLDTNSSFWQSSLVLSFPILDYFKIKDRVTRREKAVDLQDTKIQILELSLNSRIDTILDSANSTLSEFINLQAAITHSQKELDFIQERYKAAKSGNREVVNTLVDLARLRNEGLNESLNIQLLMLQLAFEIGEVKRILEF